MKGRTLAIGDIHGCRSALETLLRTVAPAPQPHVSGKIMVCGHTPQRSGRPANLGHAICLDTNVAQGGWLSCLDLENLVCWQANEAGRTRLMDVFPLAGSSTLPS